MTVTAESKPSGIGETGVTWFTEPTSAAVAREHFPHATFPKDCLTSEEPAAVLTTHMRRTALIPQTLEVSKPETVKVELPPVTVNWQGATPSQEQLENLIAEAMTRVWKRVASPVQEQREQASASRETPQPTEVDRSNQATIIAHPPSGTGQVQPQQTTPTEPRRKK